MQGESAAGDIASHPSSKKPESERSANQHLSDHRIEVKQEKRERERKDRKQQQQSEAAAMLHDYALRCLSDPSGIHRKSCSWAVARWLPMNYVPQKNIETYVFRALAAAIGKGALAEQALQTLRSLRPRFASCSASAACLVEALDQHSNQKSVSHESACVVQEQMHNLQDTRRGAKDGITSSCSETQCEASIHESLDDPDSGKQTFTESRKGASMEKSARDKKKDRVAGKKKAGHQEALKEFIPNQAMAEGTVAPKPNLTKKADDSATKGRACKPACPQSQAKQQSGLQARPSLNLSKHSALETHMRRRRHSFLPRKLAELAQRHSVYPAEGLKQPLPKGIKRNCRAEAVIHKTAQDCPSKSDPLPAPKSRRANDAAKSTRQTSKTMEQRMILASPLGDKQTVAQQLNVGKSAKQRQPNCSSKQPYCSDSTKQTASDLATSQPMVAEQNVKQHIPEATKQQSKRESAKQIAPGSGKALTTQKKRKSLLVCAQQLAIRRRRNSFVPRKIAELASAKETKSTKRQLTNPQVAKQRPQHSATDQRHAPDPAKQKSIKCHKQSQKASESESDKQSAGAVSEKPSKLFQPQNIAELGNQSARSAFKLSKDLIVNKCIEVKQKLQSMAWSPTSRRRATPVSEKSTSNVVEQLPTPVRKAARYKS